MPAAPVESCQSVALRSPWGRFGSVLYMVSRLHRMRRRIQHILANSLSIATHLSMNYLAMASTDVLLQLHGQHADGGADHGHDESYGYGGADAHRDLRPIARHGGALLRAHD